MAEVLQRKSHLLNLPGEIRNRIYRHIALNQTPIQIYAGPQYDDETIRYSPQIPALAFACRVTHDEVKSIYYEENTFHFTEYALRKNRLAQYRRQAGPSADKLTSITITRAFGVGWFAGRLRFSARHVDGKVTLYSFTSDFVNGPSWDPHAKVKDMCYCDVRKSARCWKCTLLNFLEHYLKSDGRWTNEKASVVLCQTCKRCTVVRSADVAGKEANSYSPPSETED